MESHWDRSLRQLGLFVAFASVALILYGPVLTAPFFSDDHFVVVNPYVVDPSLATLVDVLHPQSDVTKIVMNYSPAQVLLHASAWQLFGDDVRGHHALNIILHALAALLFAALLRRTGLSEPWAVFGAAVFLLHPVNVEAVAWISQLKTTSSLVLAMSALLLLERRPGLSTLAFALGLLSKPTAAFALPVAIVWAYTRSSKPNTETAPSIGPWLTAWIGLFALFAFAEIAAVLYSASYAEPIHADLLVRLRTSIAFVGRYLGMATTTYGMSAFHEPEPALSPLDPWWLAGLFAIGVLGGRALVALRMRREEAGWWVWAAVSYLPIAQILPFQFPLADRYLYPILPGLIGGALLAGRSLGARIAPRKRWSGRAMLAVALVLLALLAWQLRLRTGIWGDPPLVMAEAAANYPKGSNAALLRARMAVQNGDNEAAVAELRLASRRGYKNLEQFLYYPAWAPLRGTPAFDALIAEIAGDLIERLSARETLSQLELFNLGFAHAARRENDAARSAFERALAAGGPLDAMIRQWLAALPPSG